MAARPLATERREVTMNDIARAAGVARSTVSRILNNVSTSIPVAPETRTRVLEAAHGLGYRPNPQARALRGAPTMLLGAIVRDITDPFFAGAIEALSTLARARGYNIVLGHAHAQANKALALAAMLEARQCDALVLLGDMRDQPALIEDLRLSRAPVVALWQGTELPGIAAVDVDNRCGVQLAVAHLRSLGHRRIAFVGSRSQGDIRERREAFVDALALVGQPIELVGLEVANTPTDGVAAVRALMALELPPTAVVASTDVIAAGILHGAAALGLHVPDDLSIVGFDDIPMAAFLVPALTTIRMPTDLMVAAALDLALGAVGVPPEARSKEHRVFRPDLVVRELTAPPRASGRPG